MDEKLVLALVAVGGTLAGGIVSTLTAAWMASRKWLRERRAELYVQIAGEVLARTGFIEDWDDTVVVSGEPRPLISRSWTLMTPSDMAQCSAQLQVFGTRRMMKAWRGYVAAFDTHNWTVGVNANPDEKEMAQMKAASAKVLAAARRV